MINIFLFLFFQIFLYYLKIGWRLRFEIILKWEYYFGENFRRIYRFDGKFNLDWELVLWIKRKYENVNDDK
jgi:hypothetical protein